MPEDIFNVCGECETNFNIFVDLKVHMVSHRGLRKSPPNSYACDKCEKSFTRACNLTMHKKTHTNAKYLSVGNVPGLSRNPIT